MSGIFDTLFGGGDVPSPPPLQPPPVMPNPNDEGVKRARRRGLSARMRASGRESTILSQDYDTLGGGRG